MHHGLDNRCFYMYNCNSKRNLHIFIGDWSNGMIGVSKTFGGSSILSSPALKKCSKALYLLVFEHFHFFVTPKRV